MGSTTRWQVLASLALGLVLAGCGQGGDGASPTAVDAEASGTLAADATSGTPAVDATAATDGSGSSTRVMTLGDEAIAIDGLRCFFEEQPRAGLGGVFTHTAQGRGTRADGEGVVLDLSRARAEDGAVSDEIIVDVGDPAGDGTVSLSASGPEGLIQFGEDSASASGVELSDLGATPQSLSFDLGCL